MLRRKIERNEEHEIFRGKKREERKEIATCLDIKSETEISLKGRKEEMPRRGMGGGIGGGMGRGMGRGMGSGIGSGMGSGIGSDISIASVIGISSFRLYKAVPFKSLRTYERNLLNDHRPLMHLSENKTKQQILFEGQQKARLEDSYIHDRHWSKSNFSAFLHRQRQ